MSEEATRNLSDNRSFEERVFARFDSIDARFGSVDRRFDAMEARFDKRFDRLDTRVQALEAKALDTKPIWERALTEILEIKERVENIERKFDVLTLDMMQLRGDQRRIEKRMDLESHPQ
jgi:tetrahydromethanopterin S-methyltransferase subunit G